MTWRTAKLDARIDAFGKYRADPQVGGDVTKRVLGLLLCSVTSVLSAACSDGGPAPEEGAALAGLPLLQVELEVAIGREDDENYALSPMPAIAVTPDGGVLVPQPLASHIRVFDESGNFVQAIGRAGEGPGEFKRLARVGIIGDTIWALDNGGRTSMHFFAPDGKWLRMRHAPQAPRPYHTSGATFYPLPDGGVLMPTASAGPMILDEHEQPWLRWDANDSLMVWLPGVYRPGSTMLQTTRTLGGTTMEVPFRVMRPWRERSWVAPSPDASWLVRADYEGAEEAAVELRVVRYTNEGDTLATAAFPIVRHAVPQHVADSLLDREVASATSTYGNEARARAAVSEVFTVPELYPPLRGVLAAADGRVWLQMAGHDGTRWLLLGAELKPQAYVSLPSGFRPMTVAGDRVWGVEVNEYDVPRVVRYRIKSGVALEPAT